MTLAKKDVGSGLTCPLTPHSDTQTGATVVSEDSLLYV